MYNKIFIVMIALNDEFPSLQVAREAVNHYATSEGESYKVLKSDKRCYIIICCDYNDCKFRIIKKAVHITVFDPHTCSPATHYNFKQASLI